MNNKILKTLSTIFVVCLTLFTLTACDLEHTHTFDKQVISEDYLFSVATCEVKAKYYLSCECGEKGTDTFESGELLGHSFTAYTSDNNATCTANGTETAKCDNCVATDTREVQDSKLSHTFENYVSDNNATCDNDGTKTAKCNDCDAVDTITDEGSKLIPTDASAFYFEDGTIWGLTDYGYSLSELIIPSEIDGIQVTSICYSAFAYCTSLTSIVIPDSVTSIGEGAFEHCTSLTSIVIPDSVTSIDYSAFAYCESLTSIVIPDSVTSIGYYAFEGCYNLVEVINNSPNITVEKGSEDNGYLGYYALSVFNSGDTYVNRFSTDSNGYVIYTEGEDKILVKYVGEQTELILPNDITKINQYAFYSNDKITSVVIPDGVTSIGDYAFAYCESLASIVIPDSVTSIDNGAFIGCTSLTSIVIPDTVTSIGNIAFFYCDSLTSIVIPDSVTSIGNRAFYYCSSLTEIKYLGTVEEWLAINKDYNWCYNSMATKITCTDGETCINHSFTNYVSDNNATCMVNGTKTAKCDNCVATDTREAQNSKLPHSFTSYVSDNNATYDNDGTKTAKCDNCDTTDTIIDEGSKLVSTEYIFIFDNDCIIGLTEYGKTLTEIVIPETIDEIAVTSIGYRAFSNCTLLTSVTIDNGVQSIGSAAFSGCSSLTSVVIPDSVTSIGNSAFDGCTSLTSVTIGNGVKSIGEGAFNGCTSLSYNVEDNLIYMGNQSNPYLYLIGVTSSSIKTAIINENCIVIGDSVFDRCFSLYSVVISDSITDIGKSFDYCISLNSITIGSNVRNISTWVFEYSIGIVEVINKSPYITIEKGSSDNGGVGYYALSVSNCDDSYVSKLSIDSNGYIVYTDGCDKILVGYVGEQTELTLPNDITEINHACFMQDNITSVVIPNSVKSIGGYAFGNCTSLTSIVIPSSVTSIGYMAFANCTSLTIICEASSKPSGWDSYWDFCNTYYIIPIVWGYKG